MQSRMEKQLSYQDGVNNLGQGLKSYGANISIEENDYNNYEHSLERIVTDLLDAKKHYAYLGLSKHKVPEEAFAEAQEKIIIPIRNMIKDAINTLPVNELLTVTVDVGRTNKDSFIRILAEAGEIALFKSAYTKLKTELTHDDLINIYALLQFAYEGNSRIGEQLGLSRSFLHRGNLCYVTMAEWMLEQMDDPAKFVTQYLEAKKINIDTDLPSMLSDTSVMTLESFQNKQWQYADTIAQDETKVKAQAATIYDRFVSQHEGKNLFLHLTHNRLKQPKESLSSNFFLDIISSKSFKIALLVTLLVAGIAALTVGTLGAAGIIAGFTGAAAIAVAAAGGGTLGVTTGLAVKGFFASQPKTELNKKEQENEFFIGATV